MLGAIIGLVSAAASAAAQSKANKAAKGVADEQNKLNKEQLALEKKQYEDALAVQEKYGTPWINNAQDLSQNYNQILGQLPQQSYYGVTGTDIGNQGLSNWNAALAQTPSMQKATAGLEDLYSMGLNPMQLQALAKTYQQGIQGTPNIRAANAELADVLGGKYLTPDSNPYVKDLYDMQAKAVLESAGLGQANINQLFNQSNGFGPGNTAWEETMARYGYGTNRTLSDLATNTYGANYAQERQNMQNALTIAPQLQAADYADLAAAQGAGNDFTDLLGTSLQNLYNTQATSQQWNQAQGQGQAQIGTTQAADLQGASNTEYQNLMAQYGQPQQMSDWFGNTYMGYTGRQPNFQPQQIQLANPKLGSTVAAGLGGGLMGLQIASALSGQGTGGGGGMPSSASGGGDYGANAFDVGGAGSWWPMGS